MSEVKLDKLVLIIGKETHELDPQNELRMSEDTINEDLKNQPSYYAFYAVLEEIAEGEYNSARLELDMLLATLDKLYRDKAANTPGSKLTETQLTNQIRLDSQFLEATTKVNENRKNYGVLRAIKESFSHRKDMLIALASNMRAQQDPEIYLKKQELKKS